MHMAYFICADDVRFTNARLWRRKGSKSRLLRLYRFKRAYLQRYTNAHEKRVGSASAARVFVSVCKDLLAATVSRLRAS